MRRIIDAWGLRYPGVKHVEHIFFYGAAIADPPQIQAYLRRVDQAAGIIFRVQDGQNYYILRANALENNVNFYTYAG